MLVLSQLKNYLTGIKIIGLGCSKGGSNAVLGPIDRVGHEIDAEHRFHAKPGGELHRFDATDLIKSISVLLIHSGENTHGALTLRAPHKGLICVNRLIQNVDYRLECEGKGKI